MCYIFWSEDRREGEGLGREDGLKEEGYLAMEKKGDLWVFPLKD